MKGRWFAWEPELVRSVYHADDLDNRLASSPRRRGKMIIMSGRGAVKYVSARDMSHGLSLMSD